MLLCCDVSCRVVFCVVAFLAVSSFCVVQYFFVIM